MKRLLILILLLPTLTWAATLDEMKMKMQLLQEHYGRLQAQVRADSLELGIVEAEAKKLDVEIKNLEKEKKEEPKK
jgi:hypothetical protein